MPRPIREFPLRNHRRTIPLRKPMVVMGTSSNCLCANKVASPDANHWI